nr:hypothetical protein SDDV_ORF133 [Scale drop disease virus]
MAFRLAKTCYHEMMCHYQDLWWGVMTKQAVKKLLRTEMSNTIVMFDAVNIKYPHLFNIAKKTKEHGIRIYTFVVFDKYNIRELDGNELNVWAQSNLQCVIAELAQKHTFLKPSTPMVYDGFMKHIAEQYEQLDVWLEGKFYEMYESGSILKKKLQLHYVPAAAVSISIPDYHRYGHTSLCDVYIATDVLHHYHLRWPNSKQFILSKRLRSTTSQDVVCDTSAVDALKALLGKFNIAVILADVATHTA